MFVCAASFTACINPKQAVYLHGLPDSARIQLPDAQLAQSVIQPDDMLEIKFSGKNQQLADDFNSKGGGFNAGVGTGVAYLVDSSGYINMYMLGKVKAAGFTKEQLQEQLKTGASKYLLESSVNVRFVNFRFTVLGEVRSPSNYAVTNEKVSILEALAYAGDMTVFARRDRHCELYRQGPVYLALLLPA
jgi:polysaccharide export outer membrane protein